MKWCIIDTKLFTQSYFQSCRLICKFTIDNLVKLLRMKMNIVDEFSTPPVFPIKDSELKILSDAQIINIPFGNETLNCFQWGEGKTVILAHGWGSRASHMAFIGKFIAGLGFKVITFDAPAHSSLNSEGLKTKSSMFEFSRAIGTVANYFKPIYAVIGHSLGSAAAVFAITGHEPFEDYKFDLEKLVLISCPADLRSLIINYCKENNIEDSVSVDLEFGLEARYNFRVEDFSVVSTLKELNAKKLLIHDSGDESIPVTDAYEIIKANDDILFHETSGAGHSKLLMNRSVLAKIKDFLSQN